MKLSALPSVPAVGAPGKCLVVAPLPLQMRVLVGERGAAVLGVWQRPAVCHGVARPWPRCSGRLACSAVSSCHLGGVASVI